MVSGRSLILSPGASATEGGHPSALSYRGVHEFVNCIASEQPGETSGGENADLARQAASRGDVRIALWLAGGLAAIAAASLAISTSRQSAVTQ